VKSSVEPSLRRMTDIQQIVRKKSGCKKMIESWEGKKVEAWQGGLAKSLRSWGESSSKKIRELLSGVKNPLDSNLLKSGRWGGQR